ncbi:MAG: HAD family hydrolase [Azospirillaceae bacterium]|nr:HAD family hydrolase [Azospirillaceae bacterium]
MTTDPARGIAFFDFDRTLITGDSLVPFLAELVGRRHAGLALARAVPMAMALRTRRGRGGPDLGTLVKSLVLRDTLAGIPVAAAAVAAERLRRGWVRWNPAMLRAFDEHRRAGRRIVVATGSLDIYMRGLLAERGIDDLLATEIEVVNGVLTGRMSSGNCVRAEKANRVRAYLDRHGPFGKSWGYGNRPHDLPMLALLDHRVIV